jgi:hypothetical protein
MKKAKLVLMVVVLLIGTYILPVNADVENENLQVSLIYNFNDPTIENCIIGDETYSQINIASTDTYGDIGLPCLPIKMINILLPMGTKPDKITITTGEKNYIGSGFNVKPGSKPVILSKVETANILTKNEKIYDSDSMYPNKLYDNAGVYSYRGYDILALNLYPVQYQPLSGKLYYYNSMNVEIKLVQDNSVNNLFRGLQQDEQDVKKIVDNPYTAETYQRSNNFNFEIEADEDYHMLILTADNLKSGFQPLADAHNNDGVITKIKTLSDVGGNTPEAIKDFIKNEYINSNIQYVLLGGDEPVIPVKYIPCSYVVEEMKFDTIPSDQWYANLDDDKIDMGDIVIGRACVENLDEVGNFVSKTLGYLNRDINDYYKVLMAGEYLFEGIWGDYYMSQLIDGCSIGSQTAGIPSDKYSISKLYASDTDRYCWPSEELYTELEDGVYIVNHCGHGDEDSVMSLDWTYVYWEMQNTPFFLYSQACFSGSFDNLNGAGNYEDGDSIAEYLTVKTDYSGIFAGIFNTRYGYGCAYNVDAAPSQLFNRLFWDAVYEKEIMSIGKAHQISKNAITHFNFDPLTSMNIKDAMKDVYWELTLFGDPALSFSVPDVNIPQINGELQGELEWAPGLETTYTFKTTSGSDLEYKFTWGQGSRTQWLKPSSNNEVEASFTWVKSPYSSLVRAKARNQQGIESPWSEGIDVRIYPDDPYLQITKPVNLHKYVNNEDKGKVISIIEENFDCIIVGWIKVTILAKSFSCPIEKVEFYFDDTLEETVYEEPYEWILEDKKSDCSTIKVILYTDKGTKTENIDVKIQKSLGKDVPTQQTKYSLMSKILQNFKNLKLSILTQIQQLLLHEY